MRNFKLKYKDQEVDLKHGLSPCGKRINGTERFELVDIEINGEDFDSYELRQLIRYLNQLDCALSGNFNNEQNFELKEKSIKLKPEVVEVLKKAGWIVAFGENKEIAVSALRNHPKLKKPPLGLTPKKFHEEIVKNDRLNDVCGAISRYYNAGLKIPVEWLNEYNELINHVLINERKDKYEKEDL